jgi:hypothetical protein
MLQNKLRRFFLSTRCISQHFNRPRRESFTANIFPMPLTDTYVGCLMSQPKCDLVFPPSLKHHLCHRMTPVAACCKLHEYGVEIGGKRIGNQGLVLNMTKTGLGTVEG